MRKESQQSRLARRLGLRPVDALAAVLAAGLLLPFSPGAHAQDGARPKYQVLRQNEDWSFLAAREDGGGEDPFDVIKYVPVTGDGWLWASFGGQLRERVEAWDDFAFGAPADSDDIFLVSRLLAHADVHAGEYVRLFGEAKSSLATDRDLGAGRRTLEVDEMDVQNAFVELALPLQPVKVRLRAGRQELLFGAQRLVSPLDWSNTRRTFDGFTGTFDLPNWQVTGFFSQLVEIKKYDLNTTDDDVDLFGIYAAGKQISGIDVLDLYWLGVDKRHAQLNGSAGREDRQTFGVRALGAIGDTGLDYEFEGAYQTGEVGSADISAFMVASRLGSTMSGLRCQPRFEVGFDYASGDNEPGDGAVETFNQLFPLGHAYLGYIDAVGRQNIMDARGTIVASLPLAVKCKIDLHAFWRADTDDALYHAGGGVMRPGNAGSSREVGQELDVTLKRGFGRHVLVALGYHHFFAGEFIDQSGAGSDTDFGYAMFRYTI